TDHLPLITVPGADGHTQLHVAPRGRATELQPSGGALRAGGRDSAPGAPAQVTSGAGHPRSAVGRHAVLRRQPPQPHRRDHHRRHHRPAAGCAHQPAHRRQWHGKIGDRLRRREPGKPDRRGKHRHARAPHLRILAPPERASLPDRAPPAWHPRLPSDLAARAAPRGGTTETGTGRTCRMLSTQNPERYYARDEKVSAGKLQATQYLVVLVLAVLAAGMWRLQILGADSYRVLAEANRIRKDPVRAPRGKIFDRNGRILVDNYPSVSCYLLREQVKDMQIDIPLIARGLDLPADQVQATLRRYANSPKYESILLKQDITPDEQAFIEAHRNELPELETRDEQRRLYPRDGFAAHLIGYVGEVSEEDLNTAKFAFYEPGDMVGKSGVEETYDAILRGTDGSRDVVVNSHGKEVGQLGQVLAIPGKDLHLTIDLDIQRVAEQAMQGRNGAIVAMDPHTGEILAMVSRPTFDPNQFSVRLTKSYWSSIVNDPNHPLMNKAIQAQLAPGSTFKIIMSLAGLEENVAQDMRVMCNGGGTFYGRFFACDHHHGMVDIDHAIPWSCDTFYYTLAEKLGIDTIAKYATEVGLSQKTGI